MREGRRRQGTRGRGGGRGRETRERGEETNLMFWSSSHEGSAWISSWTASSKKILPWGSLRVDFEWFLLRGCLTGQGEQETRCVRRNEKYCHQWETVLKKYRNAVIFWVPFLICLFDPLHLLDIPSKTEDKFTRSGGGRETEERRGEGSMNIFELVRYSSQTCSEP